MSKPTDEQIKALRKGDVVTVRAVVDRFLADGDVLIKIGSSPTYTQPSKIMTIEPREIAVGDRVTIGEAGSNLGVVKCIDADVAFVLWESGRHTCEFTSSLRNRT